MIKEYQLLLELLAISLAIYIPLSKVGGFFDGLKDNGEKTFAALESYRCYRDGKKDTEEEDQKLRETCNYYD